MRSDWFFPSKLAHRLSRSEVTNREVAYLMLANAVLMSVTFYGAFTWSNPSWTLLSLIEFVAVVGVTCIGFVKCYDAAGGDENSDFARSFNCLAFGVWFWVTALVWAVFWAVSWLFRYGLLSAYNFSDLQLARNLEFIGGTFEWLWTFIASVVWSAAFYIRMARHLRVATSDA